jgi:hypothetical protein
VSDPEHDERGQVRDLRSLNYFRTVTAGTDQSAICAADPARIEVTV